MPARHLTPKEVLKRFALQVVPIWVPVYDVGIIFAYGSRENLGGYARHVYDDPRFELSGPYRGLHLSKPGYVSIVWMPSVPRTPEEVGTLTHELLHVVRRLLGLVGIPLNEDTDEAYCYLFGYLVKEVLGNIGCKGLDYGKEATNTKRKARNRVLAKKRVEARDGVRHRRPHASRVVPRAANRSRRRQAH